VRDEIEKYQQADVRPFGVNPAGVESHRRYAEKFGFPFPLLSDHERSVAAAYGALKDDGKRIRRSVILVDRDGTVLFSATGAPGADVSLATLR
jgi:peroxiredoxin Q/BCP